MRTAPQTPVFRQQATDAGTESTWKLAGIGPARLTLSLQRCIVSHPLQCLHGDIGEDRPDHEAITKDLKLDVSLAIATAEVTKRGVFTARDIIVRMML